MHAIKPHTTRSTGEQTWFKMLEKVLELVNNTQNLSSNEEEHPSIKQSLTDWGEIKMMMWVLNLTRIECERILN